MAIQTTGTLSAEMKTFYGMQLLMRALPNLVHIQFGQPRPLPRNQGKTVEFRKFSALDANVTALTEGTPPDGKALTATGITATIAQYGDFIKGSDLLDLTAIDPILTETAQLLGEQAGLSMDSVCKTILNAGTIVQRANGKSTQGTITPTDVLTVDEVRKARRTLKRAKAMAFADGCYVAIVEPGAAYDIQDDPLWQEASKYAGSTQLFTGEIGKIFGVRFVETTEANVFSGLGSGGIDVYSTLVFGQNAFGVVTLDGGNLEFIFKPLGSGGTDDPLNQVWSSGWKCAETFKILNQSFMVRIEHAVSG